MTDCPEKLKFFIVSGEPKAHDLLLGKVLRRPVAALLPLYFKQEMGQPGREVREKDRKEGSGGFLLISVAARRRAWPA
jgi:hypothetical protein